MSRGHKIERAPFSRGEVEAEVGSIHVELMVSCNRGENITDQLTEPITGNTSLVDPSSFPAKQSLQINESCLGRLEL